MVSDIFRNTFLKTQCWIQLQTLNLFIYFFKKTFYKHASRRKVVCISLINFLSSEILDIFTSLFPAGKIIFKFGKMKKDYPTYAHFWCCTSVFHSPNALLCDLVWICHQTLVFTEKIIFFNNAQAILLDSERVSEMHFPAIWRTKFQKVFPSIVN